MSDVDDRYDRYADIFDTPVTAESIELGNRVLHWAFMEWWDPRGVIAQHAREAQSRARARLAVEQAQDVTRARWNTAAAKLGAR